ncbi:MULTISPECIES: nitroreductase family protein [Pseudomonas]|uniref:Nitroreductase n=3 Tax=Pseudomonas syringae group TaxID=136849 RepID=A0A0Q0EB65_PSESX|nr:MULTISPECIES: nitroreductase family protein [Pseudomonas]KPW88365.1 Nitroreductase [Pseudomonas syringae pv. coryli]KPZ08436.1 Nitroreductase [Pseudomonas syringae pv. spinaceae]KTB78465.1 NAD(P)H nitroreductase [Pseudomonas syringae pv. syringae PD2774]KWS23016.1 NAD(P)H nitroreductase [Pseudomonas syringae pv. syringae]KWS27348.1 NAD(P)H nitroreductase [Pseudomonas syringae pv. syringae]
MVTVTQALQSRFSAHSYDPTHVLSEQDISGLIDLTRHAPSAFNLQNWRFIAVHTQASKATLLSLAYSQEKVVDAAVTFIVCGTLDPHKTIAGSLRPSVDAGILDEATFKGWVGAVEGMYADNPGMQRDEAVRSASLAAMTLMMVATEKGLASTPMIGFDQAGVAAAFNLGDREVPVMLVTVGRAGANNWPQKPRRATRDILSIV